MPSFVDIPGIVQENETWDGQSRYVHIYPDRHLYSEVSRHHAHCS